MAEPARLTRLQCAIAQLFFGLPESAGFAVAGGAALIATGMINRCTQDVDLFQVDRNRPAITDAAFAFESAATARGWVVDRLVDQAEFVRFRVRDDDESSIMDLGRDSPPEQPSALTVLGPTLHPQDLVARKVLALFGRAEGRDFADVYELAGSFGRERLLAWAGAQDAGFDLAVFGAMLASHDRLDDRDIPMSPDQLPALREFFTQWADMLRQEGR